MIIKSRQLCTTINVQIIVQKRLKSVNLNDVFNNSQINSRRNYDKELIYRNQQAKRTIFVQFVGQSNEKMSEINLVRNLYDYLKYLNINVLNVFHFKTLQSDSALFELSGQDEVNFLLKKKCSQFTNDLRLPITTRSLCYRPRIMNTGGRYNKKNEIFENIFLNQDSSYDLKDYSQILNRADLKK
jgi:hypothetical protein